MTVNALPIYRSHHLFYVHFFSVSSARRVLRVHSFDGWISVQPEAGESDLNFVMGDWWRSARRGPWWPRRITSLPKSFVSHSSRFHLSLLASTSCALPSSATVLQPGPSFPSRVAPFPPSEAKGRWPASSCSLVWLQARRKTSHAAWLYTMQLNVVLLLAAELVFLPW